MDDVSSLERGSNIIEWNSSRKEKEKWQVREQTGRLISIDVQQYRFSQGDKTNDIITYVFFFFFVFIDIVVNLFDDEEKKIIMFKRVLFSDLVIAIKVRVKTKLVIVGGQ